MCRKFDAPKITIIVNGLEEKVDPGSTVAKIIDMFGEGHKDLITEMDGRFIHFRDYARLRVSEGARLEFIHAAFGG